MGGLGGRIKKKGNSNEYILNFLKVYAQRHEQFVLHVMLYSVNLTMLTLTATEA